MDRQVVEQKLESLRHCVRRIEAKCPADAQTLVTDADLQDIVSLNQPCKCASTLALTSFPVWRCRPLTRWGKRSTCSRRLA